MAGIEGRRNAHSGRREGGRVAMERMEEEESLRESNELFESVERACERLYIGRRSSKGVYEERG